MTEAGNGPMSAIRRFVQGFNNDDAEEMQATWADDAALIDDFPPHRWIGPGVASRWYRDMAAWATGYDMADWSVELDEPRHLTVSDRDAYVVVAFVARWLEEGAPAERAGSIAASLRELEGQWRISALAWTWA